MIPSPQLRLWTEFLSRFLMLRKNEEGIRRMVGTGKSVRFYPSERLRISQKYAAFNEKSAAF